MVSLNGYLVSYYEFSLTILVSDVTISLVKLRYVDNYENALIGFVSRI